MTLKNCVSLIATYGLILLCLASASSPAFAAATCTLNTANRTVTICTPSNGATVNTTFHVNAGSTDTTAPVTYMQVYVNGVVKLTQNRNFIDADLTLPAGSNQRFTVQAHDSAGVLFKTVYSINVGATASVVVTPNLATVQAGATAQFTATVTNDPANKGVTWTVTCSKAPCGTVSPAITASGVATTYKAPATPPAGDLAVSITATSVTNTSATGSANVTVPGINVSIAPSTITVLAGATFMFTATVTNDPANKGVTWTVSCPTAPCGTVLPSATASGVATTYRAPTTPPASNLNVLLTATSVTNTSATGSANVTVPAIVVSVAPGSALIPTNITQQFTAAVNNDRANKGVTWTLTEGGAECSPTCGTISSTNSASGTPITYTAPATIPAGPTVTLTATSAEDTTKSASATITISAGAVKLVPNILAFGNVKFNKTKTMMTTVTNTGSPTLLITSITITGANPNKFAQTNTCVTSVGTGASCTITVTFRPGTTGSFSANVPISDNSSDSPQNVLLSGTGTLRGFNSATVQSALATNRTAAVPSPTGPSKVGTRVMDLVDSTRDDPYSSDGTKRELLVRFWYPTSITQGCVLAEYTSPAVWNYFSQLMRLPLPEVRTNSCQDAPVTEGAHPVIVFTHGYTGTFTDYTFIFEDLASRGYVVVSVDHTYEATAVVFPDGRFVKSVFGSHLGNTVRTDEQALSLAVSVRLSDLKFVVDELGRLNDSAESPFAEKLDTSSVALAGHSLGGLTVILGVEEEPRFRAGVVLDGVMPDSSANTIETPILLLAAGSQQWSPVECGLWGKLQGPRFAVNLRGAEHLTPSDAVWLASGAIKTGDMGPDKTVAAVRDYIAAFLDTNLRGKPSGALVTGSSADYPDAAVTTQEQQLCGEAIDH
jgi:dienelactone hydrolase